MLNLLSTLRKNVAIGFVGGSDLAKVPISSPILSPPPKLLSNAHLVATRTTRHFFYSCHQPLRLLLL